MNEVKTSTPFFKLLFYFSGIFISRDTFIFVNSLTQYLIDLPIIHISFIFSYYICILFVNAVLNVMSY